MARPLKIFLWITGLFVTLIATVVIAVPLLFDPNDHKDEVTKAVRDATGRDLRINGDVGLTLFPWLGASVADVTLGNAEGFGPAPFAQVGRINVGVRLMPLLFDRRIEVAKIEIDGLALNLAKAADGTNNWSDLARGERKEKTQQEIREETGQPMAFTIGGVDIENAAFSYTDQQSGAAYKVDQLGIETGAIELGEPLDVTIGFIVNSTQPPLESDVKLSFTALANLEAKVYELKDLKIDSTTKGPSVPGGSQKASVRGFARYDQGKGTFTFSDGVLAAAGLKVDANVSGEGLATEAPKLSGKLATNTFNPKEVAKSFGVALPPTTDPSVLTQASFSADIAGTTRNAALQNLRLKLDQTTASGSLTIEDFATKAIRFTLKADALDADRYLAPAAPEAKEAGASGKKAAVLQTEIPVDAIDALNLRGTVELGTLKLKGLSFTNIKLAVSAPQGQAKTQEMTATLYGGRIVQTARYARNSPVRYDMKLGLDAVNSAPFLKDLLGKSYLSGLGNLNLNVSSGGTTVGAILQALDGAVGTSFKDGAVEGFNLVQTLDAARALYKGQALPAQSGPKRTEFRDLRASAKIADGVLDTDTLDVKGSWYQLGGDGKVNLVEQTVNYILYPTVTGGDQLKELQGTRIPINISGSWYDPKVKVDLAGALKGRVRQEVEKQEEKVKDKAREKIGDFLRKNLPQQQPPPEQAPKSE